MAASAAGNRGAFEALYAQTSRRLLGLAMRTIGRREIAEEVLQEAYLTIWSSASRYDPERAPVFAWMATIVRRRAIDRLRAEGARVRPTHPVNVEELAARDDHTEADDLLCGAASRLAECMKALDEQRRGAITLAFRQGLTHAELAERLDVPLGTVKSWIRRGLRDLRECLTS